MGTRNKTKEMQLKFCYAMARSLDKVGAHAAREAGYADNRAGWHACMLLKKPHIRDKIKQIEEEDLPRIEVTLDRTLQELAAMAYMDPGEFLNITEDGEVAVDISNLPPGAWRLVSEIKQEQFFERPIVKAGTKAKPKKPLRGRRTTLKFVNKLTALVELSKIQGLKVGAGKTITPAAPKPGVDPLHKRARAIQKKLKDQSGNVVALNN